MNKLVGIVLIVIGLLGLVYGGLTYTTTIHATREKAHNIPLPPIAGALALIGGVALVVTSKK